MHVHSVIGETIVQKKDEKKDQEERKENKGESKADKESSKKSDKSEAHADKIKPDEEKETKVISAYRIIQTSTQSVVMACLFIPHDKSDPEQCPSQALRQSALSLSLAPDLVAG